MGRTNEALWLYQRAAKTHPKEPSVYNNIGLFYARQGRLDEAVGRHDDRRFDMAPKNPLYRNNIATVLVDQCRFREAFAHLQGGARRGRGLLQHGLPVEQKGANAGGHAAFAMALRADPSMVAAQRWIEYLEKKDDAGPIAASSDGGRAADHDRKGQARRRAGSEFRRLFARRLGAGSDPGGADSDLLGGSGSRRIIDTARRRETSPLAADPAGSVGIGRPVDAGHFLRAGRTRCDSDGPVAAAEHELRRSTPAASQLSRELLLGRSGTWHPSRNLVQDRRNGHQPWQRPAQTVQ